MLSFEVLTLFPEIFSSFLEQSLIKRSIEKGLLSVNLVNFRKHGLGNQESSEQESFSQSLLEYPQYTRPASYAGMDVPKELLSGNHEKIAQWRHQQALSRTKKRRPDLI